MDLNKEQKEAITHKNGPLLIIAGAGTGKTAVITQRIAYLIEKGEVKPEEILALTFTEKAASEMEERVDLLLPLGYMDLWISTFHSFCERILRDYALNIGLPANFKIIDNTAAWLLIRQNLDKFELDYYKPLGSPTKFIQALISHFSHCKDQGVYPEEYLKYSEKLKTSNNLPENEDVERVKEIANAYHVYQRLLLENGFLDFGDLINYCLKLFLKRPLILEKYRKKFKYILVDEFQDTNWAQYELVKILAKPKNNLTVTADDDQMIYLWRSASFNNIIQFNKDFPNAKKVSLIKNYRSSQNILDLAYNFIKQNDPDRLEYIDKINKKLFAQKKDKGTIEHISAKDLEQEVYKTIEKILEILKKDQKASYNDFVILVRANDSAIPFVRALERAGLPYQFLASRGLYSKPVILDMISYFKTLNNYDDSPALYRVLNLPVFNISTEEILKITQYSRKKTKSLYEAMEEIFSIKETSPETKEKINLIINLIKKHRSLAKEKPASEIMVKFLEDTKYLKYLINKKEKESLSLLNQFYKKIKNFENVAIEPTLNNFLDEINLEIESGDQGKLEFDLEQGPEMIKIMTIHGAKGLEFEYVFLVNMVDKRFPTIKRKELIELPEELIKDIKPLGDIHLQEERRICYVAITRAKKAIYFTSAKDYGGQRKKKLSRFMNELGYENREQSSKSENENELLRKKTKIKDSKSKNLLTYLPPHFSFSQLAAFNKCPLQYKFAFILKVPVKGKAVFSFGKTMHNVFYQFLKQINEKKDTKQEGLFGAKTVLNTEQDDLKNLMQIYEESWLDEWYESKKQKQEYYNLGKKIIKEFYKDFIKNPPKILKINDRPALEIPFNLKIKGHTLYGVIDRIDEQEKKAIIIDYKTGKSKDKLATEDKEQLLIYQIAAEEVFEVKANKLVYHYLNDNKKSSFLGSEKEKEQLKEKIINTIEQIKNSNFEPTPGWQCGFCDFKDICDSAFR